MKEKRYFCDFMSGRSILRYIVLALIVPIAISTIIAVIIGSISHYFIMNKHSYELNTYSKTTNEYLKNIANSVIKEGSSFDLAAMPEDVVEYNVTFDGNHIEFKYVLNNDLTYAPSAHMVMILSKDFRILQQSFCYNSERQYKEMITSNINSVSFEIFRCSLVVLLTCYCIFLIIGFFIGLPISEYHKERDKETLSK